MQQLSQTHSIGGRTSSPQHRLARQFCEDFSGLEENVNRYDLLILVKRAGTSAGFTSAMIRLLDHYMAFTRDCDWEEGARPVVYQSQTKTAMDLGITERQVQRLEKALFEAGAICWNDSGNLRRYGQRCSETGRIIYAFGVDLTPLASLKAKLQGKLEEKQLRDAAWLETKRQISWYRAQVRGLITELEREEGASWASRYEAIATPIRTYHDLQFLRSLHGKHKVLYEDLLSLLESHSPTPKEEGLSEKESPTNDKDVVHYNSTNQKPSNELDTSRPAASCFRESVAEPSRQNGGSKVDGQSPLAATGIGNLTVKQLLNASSERFKAHIPMAPRPMNINDLVEAASVLRPELQISQQSWGEACQTLTRFGAAICLLLTDRAALRPDDPVRKPAAYFRSLIKRAESRELNLQASIMAILKREEGAQCSEQK